MGRARFSGNRQPANSSVPAIFDRPSPYRRVAMARPFKTTLLHPKTVYDEYAAALPPSKEAVAKTNRLFSEYGFSFPPERAPSCRRGAPSLRRNVPEQNRRPSVFPCRTLCRLKEPSETAIGRLRTSSPRTVGTPTPNRRTERPGTVCTPGNASCRVGADHPASPLRPSPGFDAALTASESVPHRKHCPAYDRKTEPCRSPPVLSSSPEHRQPVAPVIRFALSRRLPATSGNGSESEPHRTSGNSSFGRQPPLSSRRGARRKNREGRPNPSDTLPCLSIVENRGPARPAAGFSVTCRKRTAKYGRIPRSEYRAAEFPHCKPPD